MNIVGGKVIVCSPGRNFVTLKLETENGIIGLGDATLNGRELAVASYLGDHVLVYGHASGGTIDETIEAARLGRAHEPHHLFWMEDPVPAENQGSLRLIRQHTTTPIACSRITTPSSAA